MSADQARFRSLFEATYPAVLRYALHRGLSGPDGEDLTAAVYEIAWRRLDSVPIGDEALPWLLKVAFNQLRNKRRKLAREKALLQRLPAPAHAPPASEAVTWQDIRRALATLNTTDRELVLLIAWDGLSPAQAAGVLGYTAVAARTRLHRARRRLAAELGIARDLPHTVTTHQTGREANPVWGPET